MQVSCHPLKVSAGQDDDLMGVRLQPLGDLCEGVLGMSKGHMMAYVSLRPSPNSPFSWSSPHLHQRSGVDHVFKVQILLRAALHVCNPQIQVPHPCVQLLLHVQGLGQTAGWGLFPVCHRDHLAQHPRTPKNLDSTPGLTIPSPCLSITCPRGSQFPPHSLPITRTLIPPPGLSPIPFPTLSPFALSITYCLGPPSRPTHLCD